MLEILGLFLQAAAGHVLYFMLHLESGSFPRPLSPAKEREAFAALRAGRRGGGRGPGPADPAQSAAGGHVTKKYYAAHASQDDLISIGTIGLIKAVDTYDPVRASKFSSYASRCIENELRMELRRVRREGTMLSLQEPLEGSEGQLTLADTLPDPAVMEDACEQRADAARLRKLLNTLPPREQQVLTRRYGLDGRPPCTQQEIAGEMGISRSYISRLEKRALEALSADGRETENERKVHAGKWNYVVYLSVFLRRTLAEFRNNMQNFGINIRCIAKMARHYMPCVGNMNKC